MKLLDFWKKKDKEPFFRVRLTTLSDEYVSAKNLKEARIKARCRRPWWDRTTPPHDWEVFDITEIK